MRFLTVVCCLVLSGCASAGEFLQRAARIAQASEPCLTKIFEQEMASCATSQDADACRDEKVKEYASQQSDLAFIQAKACEENPEESAVVFAGECKLDK